MLSFVQATNKVTFPAFWPERIYMREFHKGILPYDLKRWQPTVDAMLDGVEFDGACFLMVDQAFVPAGTTHRRPGVHVDGHWLGLGHGHSRHGHLRMGHNTHCHTLGEGESLILASDVTASRAFIGEYEPKFGEGGDCSALDLSNMEILMLEKGLAWEGNVAFIHESFPVAVDTRRTVVRLNVRH